MTPSQVNRRAAIAAWLADRLLGSSFRFGTAAILEFNDRRLVIKSDVPLVFDRAQRVILNKRRSVLAGFDDIQALALRAHTSSEGAETWSVVLDLGPFKQITVGYLRDALEASTLAARISTVTGRPVSITGRPAST